MNVDNISLENFITSAKEQLNIESTDFDIWFEKLANEAVRHYDCVWTFVKKNCILEINNLQAQLPKEFAKLLGLRFINGLSDGLLGEVNQAIYADFKFIEWCGCDSNKYSPYAGIFDIHGTKVQFYGGVEDGTKVQIAYMAFDVDENGLMKGYSDYERGVTAYICWRFTQRFFDKFPAQIREEYRQEWIAQRRWVRGSAYKDYFDKNKLQIKEYMNALVVDKGFWN